MSSFRCVFVLWICLGSALLAADAPEPRVTMLVPGFTVRELPVRISNLNNLRFRSDGTLTALGYDGRIHLLRDSDGDGLEDQDVLFWDKPTLSVPVGMAWSKEGLYVSSHGKISLLRDTDGDEKADVEEIVASGWPPTDVASGGVDATAITMDRSGNLYFGLLTADYSNPYRVKDGVSHYDLNGKRGTIQKWVRSTGQLETIATGIRVPYTLAFNREGDLFLTDQEGETWCPGGNPLDELNHIIPGRNYGFPPRDQKYLPNLISEGPVVAFGPQHQSTCGLVFNEARAGQASFGPGWWEGDALIAGESRGKIFRTHLVKTPSGYIGNATIIARLTMLTTDVAVSPRGDLYVSCHSGPPDWGTGPRGEGKVFKISYTDRKVPQPVTAWLATETQVGIAFDRPIDPSITNDISKISIEFGEYVSAADRLEVLKPPYKTVDEQERAPRKRLSVTGATVSPDHRTVWLTTDPHSEPVRYALTLPGVKAPGGTQGSTIDLDYGLNGLNATLSAGLQVLQQRIPHLEFPQGASFTRGSAEHERFHAALNEGSRLQLSGFLVLPADGNIRLNLQCSAPFEFSAGHWTNSTPGSKGLHEINILLTSSTPFNLRLVNASADSLQLHASYSTEEDPTSRPLPLSSFFPSQPAIKENQTVKRVDPLLAGGDYERGRDLYFGERLKCATCHTLRGEGGKIGPDLSNLNQRDAGSILRDIKSPNDLINPDYIAYNAKMRDGTDWSGFIRTQGEDSVRLVSSDGKEHLLPRSEIAELVPSQISLMPSGLMEGLSDLQMRDVLVYLSSAPPTRSAADLRKHFPDLAKATKTDSAKTLKIVLVASKQDHGSGQHDYPAWQKTWHELLGKQPNVQVTDAWEWPTSDQWKDADVMVFYFWNHDWSETRYRELDAYQARGGGIALFHAATIADRNPEALAERIGLAAQPGPTKYLHTPLEVEFANSETEILRGLVEKKVSFLDEPYWPMFGKTNRISVLASALVDGASRPLLWTYQKGKGRVFGSILGHYTWTFEDPVFRTIALRGIAWAAGAPAQRFDPTP